MRRKLPGMRGVAWFIFVPVLALHAKPVPPEKLAAFQIPRISQAPEIDGAIGDTEWREAVAISGVANQEDNLLFPRPTTFFLAWDKDNLYVACRTWVMPGYKSRANGRAPGTAGVGDDGLELHFQPLGKNVADGRADSSYKFFVNCLGFGGNYNRVSVGQIFMNWVPKLRCAARVTTPGTAPKGGSWLDIEFAGSTEDFELVGPNRPGDQWRLMLGFSHMPIWMQARIPCNSGYFDPSGYCLATLAENVPAVHLLMNDLPGPCDGTAAVRFRVHNPTGGPVPVNLLVEYVEQRKETVEGQQKTVERELVRREQVLTVKPGENAELVVSEPLAGDLVKNVGAIHCRARSGGKELLRYYTYFKTGYEERFLSYSPPKEAFPLKVSYNPIRSNLLVEGDAYYLEQPGSITALEYRVARDGQVVTQGRVTRAMHHVFKSLEQLQPLAEGLYQVEAELVGRDGKRYGPVSREIRKVNEAKEFAEWWNNDLGSVERVIPPFEAMKTEGNTVSSWGRSYTLGPLGLPSKVVSQNGQVMSQAARIVVEAGGKEYAISATGAPKLTEAKDWRVRFAGAAEGAGLAFSSKGWIEQDGLVYLEVTYAPKGKGPVGIDALRIEFPIDATDADCLLCIGPGGNFSARSNILIPKQPGRVWSTFDIGRQGSGMTVGSFFPLVWIGNERRGLLWWGDSDKGWVPDDDIPAHEVVRQGRTVILRNNVIGKPFKAKEPRTIAFSYMASPFRPLVKNWRKALSSFDGTFSGGPDWGGIGYKQRRDPETGKVVNGWSWLTPPSTKPEEWSAIWAQYKERADTKVRREQPSDPGRARNWMFAHSSLPLSGYGWKSPDSRVTGYFAPAEWGNREAYVKSNIDYYLYLADRAFREGGLRTIYWDIFFPIPHHTVQNGLAYPLPDGRVQPGYAGFNTRRFLMRLYALMHGHELTPGAQVSHATNAYLLVAAPWMDAILDGEFHKLIDQSKVDWVDGYPVDRMRAMSCPHNFGAAISWMDHIHLQDKDRARKLKRGLRDYVRLYDSWVGPSHHLPDSVLEWGILKAEYVPFWRNPYMTCEDKDILVSLWRLPDRVLLSVFNYNPKQGKGVELKVDLAKLNLLPAPERKWQEFVRVKTLEEEDRQRHASLDFYEQKVKIRALAPHTARLVSIRKY